MQVGDTVLELDGQRVDHDMGRAETLVKITTMEHKRLVPYGDSPTPRLRGT